VPVLPLKQSQLTAIHTPMERAWKEKPEGEVG